MRYLEHCFLREILNQNKSPSSTSSILLQSELLSKSQTSVSSLNLNCPNRIFNYHKRETHLNACSQR